ncbi:MAG: hypothetical protein WCI79_00385 [Candidatus Saccharibacteria bacterium]
MNTENLENTNCATPEKPEKKTGFWKKALIKVGLVSATAAVTASTFVMSGCATSEKPKTADGINPGTEIEQKMGVEAPTTSIWNIAITVQDGARVRITSAVKDNLIWEIHTAGGQPVKIETPDGLATTDTMTTSNGEETYQVPNPNGEWAYLSNEQISKIDPNFIPKAGFGGGWINDDRYTIEKDPALDTLYDTDKSDSDN